MDNDEFENYFAYLLDQGVYVPAGIDEDGEAQYKFVPEVAKVVSPELYWLEMNEVDKTLLDLIDKGLVQMDIKPDEDGNLDAIYSLTEAGKIEVNN
jgi:hypothetical protein